MIFFVTLAFLLILFFTGLYIIYRMLFCHPLRRRPAVRNIPNSRLYRAYRDLMLQGIEHMEQMPFETVSISSYDNCRLYGRLYIQKSDAPLAICFHGYHGTYAWDGYGPFKFCCEHGFNILLADTRAHGRSEGVITFGIKERFDCKYWTEYISHRFGNDTPILLMGTSMGAASVLMSTALGLPANVMAIVADCGYSAPADIIKETVKRMHLPLFPFYPLVRLSALLFGRFDIEEAAPVSAAQTINIPVLFIHGNRDTTVPPAMCDLLYENCSSLKSKVIIDGADHANSALTDYDTYQKAIAEFILPLFPDMQ